MNKLAVQERPFDSLAVGDSASFACTISADLVRSFADFSGDYNPLHASSDYAATTEFGKPLAHGMIIGSLFSRLIGTELPGAYAVYLSQTLQFHEPIFWGTDVIIEGTIEQKIEAFRTIKIITTAVVATDRHMLVSGHALVKVLQ